MTKKILALLLAVVFCLSLFGCKPKNPEDPTGTSETTAGDPTNAAGDPTNAGTTDTTDTTEEAKSDYENWGAGESGL